MDACEGLVETSSCLDAAKDVIVGGFKRIVELEFGMCKLSPEFHFISPSQLPLKTLYIYKNNSTPRPTNQTQHQYPKQLDQVLPY